MKITLTLALACVGACNGFDFTLSDVRVSTDTDQLLTCRNTELSSNGSSVLFSVAVTIKSRASSVASHTLPGLHSWFSLWESAKYPGAYGGLSAHIELLSTVTSGRGLLAFTTRAQPENLCRLQGKANFGPNFISKHFDARQGAREYDNLLLGRAMSWGYGAGYSMGMGGFVNNYGTPDDDGVVAEIPVIAGTVSTLTLDSIPFKHVGDLAGRGLLVCSKVSATGAGDYVCEKPFYACCQLHYDSKPASLQVNTGIHGDDDDDD